MLRAKAHSGLIIILADKSLMAVCMSAGEGANGVLLPFYTSIMLQEELL